MQNIGNVSILGMFIMYFLTATFGYLTFYGETSTLPTADISDETGLKA